MRHLATALLFLLTTAANAAVITTPVGLNNGDQYRLVFVTSITRDGTSTNIVDYNNFVTGVANSVTELAALGTTWKVLGSTSAIDARDNTNTNPGSGTGVPIYLLNSTKLANNNADFWDGFLNAPLNVTETGGSPAYFVVGTGSLNSGTKAPNNELGKPNMIVGSSSSAGFQWMNLAVTPPQQQFRFYAMSGILTAVVVPIPPAVWLFGSALGVMGWMRRKLTG